MNLSKVFPVVIGKFMDWGGEIMDNAEFKELLRQCQGAVKRYVFYKLPTKSIAEDIFQEVLLTAFQQFDSLKDKNRFKAWVLRIAANKCHDYYRHQARQLEVPMDDTTASILTQSRIGITVQDAVRDTLEDLADKDKEILSLYYFGCELQA